MESLDSAPIASALALAPALLAHPATQCGATVALLCRLPLEEPAAARRLLQTLCAYGVRGRDVSAQVGASAPRGDRRATDRAIRVMRAFPRAQLLELLPVLPAPTVREVLEIVPRLLDDTAADAEAFLDAARALMSADRTLLLPTIGALGEVRASTVRPPGPRPSPPHTHALHRCACPST